jgi:hypothetical protein
LLVVVGGGKNKIPWRGIDVGLMERRKQKGCPHLEPTSYKKLSAMGNRTPVSRMTGGDTSHYTIAELRVKHK